MSSISRRGLASRVMAEHDPRQHGVGAWAFLINRLSALGLSLYLFLHLAVLGQLAQGERAYDGFIALAKSPLFLAGELLVIIAGLFHGLNGLRIALTSFGIGVRHERELLYGVLALSALGGTIFAIRMFGG